MAIYDLTLHNTLVKRLDQCDKLIRSFKGPANIRMDLKKMYSNVHIEYVKLDNILVDCRRLKRMTSAYTLQAERLDQLITSVEKRITWASLL